MLSKLNLLSLKKHLSVWVNSLSSRSYHRQVSTFRKHKKNSAKPNYLLENNRNLDEVNLTKPNNKPSRSIWKTNKKTVTDKANEKVADKVSFSHRAVAMRTTNPGLSAQNEREKQMEINRLTNYFIPKVHKLNPSQISQSITIRSKLAKLLPKKDLYPKIYPKSSILMQKHLRLLKPCDNYKRKHTLDMILDKEKKLAPTPREKLNEMKRRCSEASRFTSTRMLENTPWSKSSFLEQAIKLVRQRKGVSNEMMTPLNNLITYAKHLAKSVKSKK